MRTKRGPPQKTLAPYIPSKSQKELKNKNSKKESIKERRIRILDLNRLKF
jgi:hypothetical protein